MKIHRAVRMERCIGCHSCSLACARLVYKSVSWNRAGIRIRSTGGVSSGFQAILCLACDPAPCAAACPTGAMVQRKSGGGVLLKKNLCIQCGQCAAACPVEAIALDAAGSPAVCVHCGQCIAYCPHDCLELVEADAAVTAPCLESCHVAGK